MPIGGTWKSGRFRPCGLWHFLGVSFGQLGVGKLWGLPLGWLPGPGTVVVGIFGVLIVARGVRQCSGLRALHVKVSEHSARSGWLLGV